MYIFCFTLELSFDTMLAKPFPSLSCVYRRQMSLGHRELANAGLYSRRGRVLVSGCLRLCRWRLCLSVESSMIEFYNII